MLHTPRPTQTKPQNHTLTTAHTCRWNPRTLTAAAYKSRGARASTHMTAQRQAAAIIVLSAGTPWGIDTGDRPVRRMIKTHDKAFKTPCSCFVHALSSQPTPNPSHHTDVMATQPTNNMNDNCTKADRLDARQKSCSSVKLQLCPCSQCPTTQVGSCTQPCTATKHASLLVPPATTQQPSHKAA